MVRKTIEPVPRHVTIMRISISLTVLIICFLILTPPNFLFPTELNHDVQAWAAGWIGLVIGYWLS